VNGLQRRLLLVAGIGGPAVVSTSAFATAIAYRGSKGQPYSPLSHWVSELGEEDVSRLAPVFNAGTVVGGACLGIVMTSLAMSRRGGLARAYGPIGAVAGLAGALVGRFPMNRIVPHAIASVSFFNLTALAIALASVDFAKRPEPRFGRIQASIGAAATAAFVAFGVVASDAIRREGLAALEAPDPRGAFSPLTSLEWATLLLIMAWVVSTSWRWAGTAR
jgi:hypothetical membrane protein